MDLYSNIKQIIVNHGFQEKEDGVFTKVIVIPGVKQQVIINGKAMNQQINQQIELKIISLGIGEMWDESEDHKTTLYGFQVGKNDIWVDSVEDFNFWLQTIFQGQC